MKTKKKSQTQRREQQRELKQQSRQKGWKIEACTESISGQFLRKEKQKLDMYGEEEAVQSQPRSVNVTEKRPVPKIYKNSSLTKEPVPPKSTSAKGIQVTGGLKHYSVNKNNTVPPKPKEDSVKEKVPVPTKSHKRNHVRKRNPVATKWDSLRESELIQEPQWDNIYKKTPVQTKHNLAAIRLGQLVPVKLKQYRGRGSQGVSPKIECSMEENEPFITKSCHTYFREKQQVTKKHKIYTSPEKEQVPAKRKRDDLWKNKQIGQNENESFLKNNSKSKHITGDKKETQCDGEKNAIEDMVPVNHDRHGIQTCNSIDLYPGLSGICHRPDFSENILHGEIPIEILDFTSVVLKRQFSIAHGMLLPSRLYAHVLENRPLPDIDCIPSDCTAVQIHYIQGHYVVSYQFMKNVTIYDSMPYVDRLEQVLPQLKILYKIFSENLETPVSYCIPQHQGNSTLCGAFVVAFTVALLLKQTPLKQTNFIFANMRAHLLSSLQQQYFDFFPSEVHEMPSLQNYFQSQANLQDKYAEGKLMCAQTNRMKRHRSVLEQLESPEQQTERRRNQAARRKQQRVLLSLDKQLIIKNKDRTLHQKQRALHSPQTKSQINAKETSARRHKRKLLPAEKQAAITQKNSTQHQLHRDTLSLEEEAAVRRKETAGRNQQRKLLPTQTKALIRQKDSAHHQLCRDAMSLEEEAAVRRKETAGRNQQRKLLPTQTKALIRQKDSAHHQLCRDAMSLEEEAAVRRKETAGRKQQRKLLPTQTKALIRHKDSAHHQVHRDALSSDEEAAVRRKETAGRKQQRKLLPPHTKALIRQKDSAHHQLHRDALSSDEEVAVRRKETAVRKQQRKLLPPHTKTLIRQKDSAHHQLHRCMLSSNEEAAVRRKETAVRKQQRKLLPPHTKALIRQKDSAHHQLHRDALSSDEEVAVRRKETAVRKQQRKLLPPHTKALIRQKDSAHHQLQRDALSSDEQVAVRRKETAGRNQQRKLIPAQTKVAVRQKDSAQHQLHREALSAEEEAAVRGKETTRRKQQRKLVSPQTKVAVRQKDSAQHQLHREALSVEEEAAVRGKETTRRKQQRKLLSAQKKTAIRQKDSAHHHLQRHMLPPEKRKVDQEKDQQRKQVSRHSAGIQEAMTTFLKHIKEFPEYVCTCCDRMLYKKSVSRIKVNFFADTKPELTQACRSRKMSPDGNEWICNTCSKHIKRNSLPPQANANHLALPVTPPELRNLSTLEERLLSQRYPFMKLLALPKGRQSGIKGAVVNVPVQAEQVCNTLPKTPNEAGFIPLKLKRKLKYSGHHSFQYIRPNIIKQAFRWLKNNNSLYFSAVEREHWEDDCKKEDEEVWKDLTCDEIATDFQKERVFESVRENSNCFPETVYESPDTNQDAPVSIVEIQGDNHDIPDSEPDNSRSIPDFVREAPGDKHGIPDSVREPPIENHGSIDCVQESQGYNKYCGLKQPGDSSDIPVSVRESASANQGIPDSVRKPENGYHSIQDLYREPPADSHRFPDSVSQPPGDTPAPAIPDCVEESPDGSYSIPATVQQPSDRTCNTPKLDHQQQQRHCDDTNEEVTDTEEYEESSDSKLRGIKLDTCVQPDDLALQANKILSMAPGEGKRPISILTDNKFEEMCFPTLFPTGQFGLTHPRPVSLSTKKYFQRRILQSGGKFASNIEYLFVAQFLSEWQQIRSSISVALRKSFAAEENGGPLTASVFKDPERIRPLLMKDDAYRFLRPIRGSPPYWQQVMFKLLAAIKQLKIFTWFLTLSAADLRWTDTLQGIARQQGRTLSEREVEEMTWEDKCELLRSNPVTAARHFHYKLQCLFTDVILSDAAPLGKVTHYFYRIEFQQRGSPHAHAIIWVEGAPQPDADRQTISDFVDRYVQACIPEVDGDLKTLVTDLQRHSHSASCRKKGSSCRFHFPRPPADRTILSKSEPDKNEDALDVVKKRKFALEILTKVMDTIDQIQDLTNITLEELLSECDLSLDLYHKSLSIVAKDPTLHLQRKPSEILINNYNVCILLCWKANMDLQFVVSPYAAIHYITSYVTKDEREMGLILQLVSREMKHLNISKQMNKVADSFANSRNVSAQEAVYRLLGLPLYTSNFKTVWIPTGFSHQRVRILKTQALISAMEDDEPDIFMANLLDRYAARPTVLNKLSLAEFAMWYEVSPNRETDESSDFNPSVDRQEALGMSSTEIPQTLVLSNNLGTMKKKLRPNVIRFHQCSMTKDPELFFYNKMLLFLPWKNESTDMLGGCETYCEHYHNNKELIEAKETIIMRNADMVDQAVEKYQQDGPPTHIWDEIAPETEHAEADAIDEGVQEDIEHSILCPDGQHNLRFTSDPLNTPTQALAVELIPEFLPEPEYQKLVRSLNNEQRSIFQHLLNWCQAKANRPSKIPAEYIFVTGGAGTGKSHLIKAIHNMANFTFRKAGQNPSQVHVLLMAPTGTAAFNIGAPTIHAALLLPKNLKTYIKLSDDKCNTLRVKLQSLTMVIIDEISLVGSDMLVYINKRLQQIIGCSKPFGGIAVITFGDLYQLPPVAQPFVYDLPSDNFERLAGSVWQRNFRCVQLNEIMRQKEDQAFASLLNRVRKAEHDNEDVQVLQNRVVQPTESKYMTNSLHIFARNADVDAHNDKLMRSLNRPVIVLEAKEKRPACLKGYVTSEDSRYTGGVSKEICICENARVMITRNIDVQDGLVNGAQGTILGFIPKTTNGKNVKAVIIQFDRPGVGSTAIAASRFDLSDFPSAAVPITPVEIRFTVSKSKQGLDISWIQFPLKLAFACTIHKVQGATLDRVVVSFKNRFSPGQAYVALSRARTLEGLQLLDFEPEKIRANKNVQREMNRILSEMHLPSPYFQLMSPITCSTVQLCLLNASSAKLHYKDIASDPIIRYSSVVGLTETHFTERKKRDYVLKNFRMFMKDQNTTQNHHGLALYVSESFHSKPICFPFTVGFEVQCIELNVGFEYSYKVVLLYRSPSLCQTDFLDDLNILLTYLQENSPQLSVLMGDFNVDWLNQSASRTLSGLMNELGWKQMVTEATHRSGSCLDHVYIRQGSYGVVSVLPAYFSDHHFVHMQLL